MPEAGLTDGYYWTPVVVRNGDVFFNRTFYGSFVTVDECMRDVGIAKEAGRQVGDFENVLICASMSMAESDSHLSDNLTNLASVNFGFCWVSAYHQGGRVAFGDISSSHESLRDCVAAARECLNALPENEVFSKVLVGAVHKI